MAKPKPKYKSQSTWPREPSSGAGACPAALSPVLFVATSPDAGLGAPGQRLAVKDGLLLGRDPDGPGAVAVDDPRVSREHLRVVWDPAARSFRALDCDSTNGLHLNGHHARSALLANGDVLRIGDTLLVVVADDRMRGVQQDIDRAARTAVTVLFMGETGTGKEVLARRLHAMSGRTGEFVAVNCAALPRELAAAELFGHARGAFSGARQAREGLFAAAHGGTILLDEIGDVAPEVQVALLRVLDERRVRPLGSNTDVAVDVRIVGATNRDLRSAVAEGTFRADLYARLAQLVVQLPPLRARRHEIAALFRSFLAEARAAPVEVPVDTMEALLVFDWPLNVRELRSLAQAWAATAAPAADLDFESLARLRPELGAALNRAREQPLEPVEAGLTPAELASRREELVAALDGAGGNITEAALRLGRPRSWVYRWLRTLDIRRDHDVRE